MISPALMEFDMRIALLLTLIATNLAGWAADAPSWPIFRGDARLSGLAEGSLPNQMALLWSFKTGDAIKSSPVIGNGLVYIGSSDGKVYALNLTNGTVQWKFNTDDSVEAPPLLWNGTVYVGVVKGLLFALDARDGKVKWQYETAGKIMGSANCVPAPDGNGQWILIGSYDNTMHCVDATSGKRVWTYETQNFINGAPAVAAGKLVFGGCDAQIHVVSVADGKSLAKIDAGSYIAASAALDGHLAFVGNYGGKLLCVDLVSQKTVWSYGNKETETPFFASPAIGVDRIIAGCRDNSVHCVSRKDGQRIWVFKTRGDVDSSPVICGDKVVACSVDGRIYLLKLSDGTQVWSYELGAPIIGSPAVAGGWLIVGADDGRVYAFGPKK